MTVACFLTAIAAFALFGISTEAHHQSRLGLRPAPARKRALRRGAWAAVALCAAFAFAAKGPVYGAIFWLGALSLGAAVVFLFLNLAPARSRKSK
jgi:hypothetical protein